MTTSSNDSNLIILDYNDLLRDPISSFDDFEPLFTRAFGTSHDDSSSNNDIASSPLGLIAVRNIPQFTTTKQAFLPLAHNLVNLPPSYLNHNLTDETSMYNAGYSYGREMLKLGKPDLYKASYYFNPVTDMPGTAQDREKYPASYPTNVWPSSDQDDNHCISNFESLAKELGCLMKHVVVLLSKHIDVYIQRKCTFEYPQSLLSNEMENTEKVKARLLYYFPIANEGQLKKGEEEIDVDSWIGWHNDSGFLTALAGDIYVDHATGELIDQEDQIDPNAGLHVMDRTGTVTKVDIPQDCMGVQIGECLQIVSGGTVVATPHCVRGVDPNFIPTSSSNNDDRTPKKIARISLPCFIDTQPSFPLRMPPGCRRDDVLKNTVQGCAKVPPLSDRWTDNGVDFGTFLQKTFSMYYSWDSTESK